MKYDAFISYRRENGFLMAQVIRDRLKDKGISCFLDLEEARSGKFDENLLRAIRSAPNFILILPKNALTRCKNQNDWVRREILAAVESHKTIIPVMYDGFRWPEKWPEGIPEEIKQLKFQQAVSMSQEYLSAMIDKIVSYMTDISPTAGGSPNPPAEPELPTKTEEFMAEIQTEPSQIDCVCMAFHAGADWRRSSGKVKLLQFMLDHGIPLRVLVNDEAAVKMICSHMQQPLKRYVGFNNSVADWMELAALYPGTVQVRVSHIPLIHRTYLIRKKDGGGLANIKFYTYGNYTPDKDFRLAFRSGEPEYTLYDEEFAYLWDKSAPQST